MTDFTQARQNMVVSQIQPNGVLTAAILDRFADVPRELFVPAEHQAMAYCDTAIDVGQGREMMAPLTLARMIETLAPAPMDRALCLGGLTGYGATILAGLVDHVADVEGDTRFDTLARHAQDHVGSSNINRVTTPPTGPFDVVLFESAAAEQPLDLARALLAPNGRMVVVVVPSDTPVGSVVLIEKSSTNHVSSRVVFDAFAPYLPGYEPVRRFAFS